MGLPIAGKTNWIPVPFIVLFSSFVKLPFTELNMVVGYAKIFTPEQKIVIFASEKPIPNEKTFLYFLNFPSIYLLLEG